MCTQNYADIHDTACCQNHCGFLRIILYVELNSASAWFLSFAALSFGLEVPLSAEVTENSLSEIAARQGREALNRQLQPTDSRRREDTRSSERI